MMLYVTQWQNIAVSFPCTAFILPQGRKGKNMEYISKKDLVDVLEKFKKAREAKKNCSKQSATEYAMFDYVLKIIDTLKTVEKD